MKASNKLILLLLIAVCNLHSSNAQRDTQRWTGQIAVGINNPIDDGTNDGYFTKYANIPTINIGVQHMFKPDWGARLDLGFNRASNADGSLEFKLNYTRVNTQIVYNATNVLGFLPERLEVVAHAGPGLSFTSPLAPYNNNTYTYLNLLAGGEIHYRLSRGVTIFTDLSYALSLAGNDKYDVNVDGFSFNGDLLYLTFGVTFALSGCQYC
ncbi:porin family protein [Paucihalobacter ruber]|uniref:Porin family protein n=1 Tax=Paucihalobacter ruber TaxID=2567861 RepID=A0A506PEI0_9FLAO|nr:outer membrane beta-barrel protein [Paucihalobacter ruber]TPV31805.1 porin family protein [Paucihalobacter ruber]